jgi:hypothetical protein
VAIVDSVVLTVLSFLLGVVAELLALGLFGDGAHDGLNRFLGPPGATSASSCPSDSCSPPSPPASRPCTTFWPTAS